jgi:hypothetical protein
LTADQDASLCYLLLPLRVLLAASVLIAIGGTPLTAQTWNSMTYNFSDALFKTASTTLTNSPVTFTVPTAICGLTVNVSAAFAGTGITTLTVQAGSSVNDTPQTAFSLPFSMLTPVSPGYSLTNQLKLTTTANYSLNVVFTSNVNFGNGTTSVLTGGQVKVSYCYIAI